MKFVRSLADRTLERLAPTSKAEASNGCYYAYCSENCYKYCCPTSGCTSICVCF